MLKRTITAAVILVLTIGFFAMRFISPYIFDVYLGFIAILATYEVCRVYTENNKKVDIAFVLPYPLFCYLTFVLCSRLNLSLIVYFAIAFAILIVLFTSNILYNNLRKNKINKEMVDCSFAGTRQQYTKNKVLRNLFLMIYPSFLVAILFIVNHINLFVEVNGNLGFFALILIFATTMATDTGALLIGMGIGGKKLCPSISPNKTISGAIGGVLSSVTVSLVVYYIFKNFAGYSEILSKFNILILCIYAVVASIYTQLGDIFASKIKRNNNTKDFGNILPGHGGIMDRVDGLIFNGIISFIFLILLFI